MRKRTTIALIIFNIVLIVTLYFTKIDKGIINKLSLFLTASLALLISYLTGIIREKNGLINGLVIGITIAMISAIIHYFYAKDFFDLLYIRLAIFILAAISGGVFGVNKQKE